MPRTIDIADDQVGRRADVVATEALPSLSRAYVHRLFEENRITLGGEAVKPGHKLRYDEALIIDFDESEVGQIPDIDLPIIFEDDDVLVVDKPPGVISHARGKFWNEPSVASFVRQKTGQEGERAGIVHRLDRVTSGVMVCAKNQEALSHLQKQFSLRKTKKAYVGIVTGHLKPETAIIDMPIERNPTKPQTFHTSPSGKQARTKYTVEKSLIGYDVVKLEPETGRTHQLRVHLQQIGHPIVGDHLYNGGEAERLYLHAQSLEITLPDGERKVFRSHLPQSFVEFEQRHEA